MPTPAEWKMLIDGAKVRRQRPLQAETYLKKWPTKSQPVLVRAAGKDVVVKGAQAGRQTINDQVVGHLGLALGAPVGRTCLIEVVPELIAIEPAMAHIRPGLAHGSFYVPNYSERLSYEHALLPENRDRFARLAILYGWMRAGDHQFIYSNDPPPLVLSVDHGHFFPDGPDWTMMSLRQAGPPHPDLQIVITCGLTLLDLQPATQAMRDISDGTIALAVASPPDEWGITMEERIGMASYLSTRRDDFDLRIDRSA